MAKITRATFKSFVKNNEANLLIKVNSRYDGSIDGLSFSSDSQFRPATRVPSEDGFFDYNLGFKGIWLVGRASGDFFKLYEDETYIGIAVSNCCGRFIVTINK